MENENLFDKIDTKVAGLRIVEARKKIGITQSQLSKIAGVDLSTLNQLEQGKVKVTEKYLVRVSLALGFDTPEDMFGLRGVQIGYVAPLPDEAILVQKIAETCGKTMVGLKGYDSVQKLLEALRKRELNMVFIANDHFLFRQFELVPIARMFQSGLFLFAAIRAGAVGVKTQSERMEDFFRQLLVETIRSKTEDKDSALDLMFFPQWIL